MKLPASFSLPSPGSRPPELLRPARASYIALTVMIAAMLNLLSLPEIITRVKPDFLALILIYWTVFHPERVSFTVVWMLGLAMDVASGSLFGQHALSYTLILYLSALLHRRIIMFPLGYQVFHVVVVLIIAQVAALALRSIAGSDMPSWSYFLPSVTGAILWPLISTMLRAPLRQTPEQNAT